MSESVTITGNRGLDLEEKLIFEQDKAGRTAVDLPEVPPHETRLGAAKRRQPIGLHKRIPILLAQRLSHVRDRGDFIDGRGNLSI